jgi:hypothetical protein
MDMLLPQCAKSNKVRPLPSRVNPYTESELPTLEYVRKEQLDPALIASRIERLLAQRAMP